jgi:hypothetical protein
MRFMMWRALSIKRGSEMRFMTWRALSISADLQHLFSVVELNFERLDCFHVDRGVVAQVLIESKNQSCASCFCFKRLVPGAFNLGCIGSICTALPWLATRRRRGRAPARRCQIRRACRPRPACRGWGRGCTALQGLTLIHISAQRKPFLTRHPP